MSQNFVDLSALEKAFKTYKDAKPFHYAVIENFLTPETLANVEREFLDFSSPKWFCYKNAIEDKKALNDWNAFPKETYQLFSFLNSDFFLGTLSKLVGVKLHADNGLHGGGWHIHGPGGNLNPHLDYSIHPKLQLERKLNIIVYVSKEMEENYGGHLGLWTHDTDGNRPGQLVKEIQPKLNRAVIFDTTQNSWHGMSRPLSQPEGIYRKSLAIYYLCNPSEGVSTRGRALFASRETQKGDPEIEELIRLRSDVTTSTSVYRK